MQENYKLEQASLVCWDTGENPAGRRTHFTPRELDSKNHRINRISWKITTPPPV